MLLSDFFVPVVLENFSLGSYWRVSIVASFDKSVIASRLTRTLYLVSLTSWLLAETAVPQLQKQKQHRGNDLNFTLFTLYLFQVIKHAASSYFNRKDGG